MMIPKRPLRRDADTLSASWIMGISKTSDHIQIKIKMPNPSQEPPASSKTKNEEFRDMDVLCIFKIRIEIQNLENECTKD